jgi:hypothetical protein
MPLEQVAYGIAVPLGKITTPQHKDRDSEVIVGEATLRGLVQVAENGKPKVLLLQNGKEVARFPISTEGLQGHAREALTWTTKTAQAMTARKACPAD